MPKAANGGYTPGAPSGTASGQPSLWGSSGGDGGGVTKSYAGPSVQPEKPTYTATGSDVSTEARPTNPQDVLARQPTPPTPTPKPPSVTDVGSFGVDLSSPAGMGAALHKDQSQANNLFDGLAGALFGNGGILAGPTKAAGDAIGNSALAPVAGAVGSVAGPVFDTAADIGSGPVNAVTGVARNAVDAVGTVADHIPTEAIPFMAPFAAQTEQQFNAIPDSPEKQKVEAQIAGDPLGGGHLKSEFIRQYVAGQQKINPQLLPELATPAGSLGDTIVNLLGGMSVFSRPIERGVAGAAKADGLNRLQAIEAVAEGRSYSDGPTGPSVPVGNVDFAAGKSGLSDGEQFAYNQWKSGAWSSDQALTFLAAAGSGFSHDPALEIGGQVALDPTVWGSLGASALSKLGIAGLRLAAAPAEETLRAAGTAGKYNLLGRLAESEKVSNTVRAIGGTYYTPLQDTVFGQAAKTVRTIIDPFHAIGGHSIVDTAGVDVASEAATRVMDGAYGELASRQVVSDMNDLGLLQDLADAKATYSANKARGLLLRQFVQGQIEANLAGDLKGHVPSEFTDALTHSAPKDWADLLKQDMVSVAKRDWNGDAVANLGERMASFFGGKSAGEWASFLSGKSTDYLGHLHAATYGAATRDFLDAIGDSTNLLGVAGAQEAKLPRLILLNKTTLTDIGARGILEDLKGAKSLDEAMAFITDAKQRHPELGYVSIDPVNPKRGIEQFTSRLEHQIEDGVLPAQLVDREIAKLPQPLQDLYGKMATAFDFGFRPEDDKLFGLGFNGEGQYAMHYEPWVDHVAVSHPGYRGIQGLRYNAAGMPLIGEPIGKTLDYIEAGAKTLTARVNTATIVESAKSRFAELMAQHAPALPQQDARALFDAVSEAAQLHKVTPRGLSASDMWKAVEGLIPDSMRLDGTLTQRDFMTMIVHAYEGDLRFVGLTQKFTGRAKKLFADATGSNFAGQLSENLYTKIKFWANPVFQAQERAEPWVLNSMRGSNPAFGTKLTAADRMTIQEMRNLRDSGVIRATDVDQAEFAAYGQIGDGIAAELAREDPSFWNQLHNVAGAKRVNEIRTFQTNMGQAMRDIFEQNLPGEWDKIVARYSASDHALISDGEAAARYIAEQHLAGDVHLQSVIQPGDDVNAFQNAIRTADWYRPNALGEVKGLNLDFMARAMSWTTRDGKKIGSVGDLRAALADHASGITIDRVGDTLRSFGAHEDYIRRVENALDFHWDGFWRTAQKRYNLSTGELDRLRGVFIDSARVRGMTPVDYMSQVYSPMIGSGSAATVESLDSAVSVLRAPAKGADATDLAFQLGDIFRHHLDPSGQQTLIEAFEHDLPSQINATMQRGAKVTSQNLQATLSQFRGGDAKAGGAVLPTHAMGPDGLPRGRFISQAQTDALTQEGKAILAQRDAAPRSPIFQAPPKSAATGPQFRNGRLVLDTTPEPPYDRLVDGMFERVQQQFGGGTFDPHTGEFLAPTAGADGPFLSALGQQSDIPIADAADPAKFRAALDSFVADNRTELEKAGHYVGVFRNEDTGLVEFDVSAATASEREAEAVLLASPQFQTGGAYNLAKGQSVYTPVNRGAWQAEHSEAFGRAIREYVEGAQPTDAFQAVTDPARGVEAVRNVADNYMKSIKMKTPPRRLFPVDENFGERTAKAYESLPSSGPIAAGPPVTAADVDRATNVLKPTPAGVDEATVRAYQAFVNETMAQYKAIKKSGITFEPTMADPYPNSAAMVADVRDNKHLSVYAGSAEHPLMTDAQTVMFRGVHDYFAHAAEGFQFGPRGELNAAIKHSQMYTAEARRAMLTETHGQNSVVNFSKARTPDGRTIAEVNKATPGAIYAEQKAGLLPQAILDEFGQRYIGAGSGLASHPDVIRASQQYVKWAKQVLGGGFLGDDPAGAQLLQKLGGIPTDAATPANHMHSLMVNQVTQAQRMAGEDAFRLQYFARNRTFLERSINHPFFGIYPASYMWGKIAPEMARFMALSPFGLRTGAGLRAMQDFQTAVASQREFDPSFEQHMDKLGSGAVAWFLGYMLPSLPWDVGAAAPSWMRDIAQQGLDNQQRVDRGEAPKPIDLAHALTKVGDYINPLRPAGQIERPIGEIGDALNGGAPADKQKAARDAKKAADDQARYEKTYAEAIVAIDTARSRLKIAKTKAGKQSAQEGIDQAQRDFEGARASLQTMFPNSPKLQVQPNAPASPAPSPQGFAMRPTEPNTDNFDPSVLDPGSDFYETGDQNRVTRARNARPQGDSTIEQALKQTAAQSQAGPVQFNPNAQLDTSQIDYAGGLTDAGSPDQTKHVPVIQYVEARNRLLKSFEDLGASDTFNAAMGDLRAILFGQ